MSANAFTEETARTRRFAGIAFRGDDAQRRAWVIGSGLDVWEIIEMLDDFASPDALLADTQVSPAHLRLALAYRDAHPSDQRHPHPVPLHRRGALRVRLLLDANLSAERIGAVLEKDGHDVLSLASDAELGALDDPQVLELAADQDRILVTRNSRDFAQRLRHWSEAGRHHAGCILIWTMAHHEYGAIRSRICRLLDDRPDPEEWRDLAIAL